MIGGRWVAVFAVRVALPIALAIVGIAAIIVGHAKTPVAGAGVVLLGVALMVFLINWLFRLSVESNREREVEEAAREYFDRTGRWPDEDAG